MTAHHSDVLLLRDAASLKLGTRILCREDWIGVFPRTGTVVNLGGFNYYQLDNPETLPPIPHPDTNELIPDDGVYYLLNCEIVNDGDQ